MQKDSYVKNNLNSLKKHLIHYIFYKNTFYW